MRRKVTVVGAGNVGATCAQVLAAHDYADVVLVDIKEGLPQGKALDINQMGAVLGYEPRVTGSNSYDESAGSDVVVITAGLPRSPGMSRDDLVATNEKIVKDVTEKAIAKSPEAILIVVSNPLDAMCHVAKNVSGLAEGAGVRHGRDPRHRALLDLHRLGDAGFRQGRHRHGARWPRRPDGAGGQRDDGGRRPTSKVGRRSRRSTSMVQRTAKGGGELVELLGTSAWYAPGAAAAQMVDAIMLDEKRVLPCTAYLEGEYGIDGLYMGVPVKLGSGGIEAIYQLDLSKEEQAMLDESAGAVREVVELLTS